MSSGKSSKYSGGYWLRLGLFTTAVVAIPLLIMLFYIVQRQIEILVTPNSSRPIQTPSDFNLPFQDVSLITSDGLKLAAWYIPGSRSQAIILVHSLNSNRGAMLPTAQILAEAGYHLLLIDLRGHGDSEGHQISYGYREAWDVQAAADYLAALPEIESIGAVGNSLGGAAVARAAAEEPRLEAVVIQSSYSSLPDAVNDAFDDFSIFPHWPFAPLIIALAEQRVGLNIGDINSARDLSTITPRDVLIIHNNNDRLFPRYHAEKMYNAAQEPKDLWIIDSPDHGDPASSHKQAYQKRVTAFFETAFGDE